MKLKIIKKLIKKYGTQLPFLIYIDDDNVFDKNTHNLTYENPNIDDKLKISYGKYSKNDNNNKIEITNNNPYFYPKHANGTETTQTFNTEIAKPNNDINYILIQLPQNNDENSKKFKYENDLNHILDEYKINIIKLQNKKLLIVYDFDCTLSSKHLFLSQNTIKYAKTHYSDCIMSKVPIDCSDTKLKENFTNAFSSSGTDILKEKEMEFYFGSPVVRQKQFDMFEKMKYLITSRPVNEQRIEPVIPDQVVPSSIVQSSIGNFGFGFDGVLHLRATPMINNINVRKPYGNFLQKVNTVRNIKEAIFNESLLNFIVKIYNNNETLIITSNTNIKDIKNYIYNKIVFSKLFHSDILTIIPDIYLNKKVKYCFDDSNNVIIAAYDKNINSLQKIYKVFPETTYDIFDYKDYKAISNDQDDMKLKPIGTLNPLMVELIKKDQNQEIKVFTYNIKYIENINNLNKNETAFKKIKETLYDMMANKSVDFMCLQEFNYVDSKTLTNDDGSTIINSKGNSVLTFDENSGHPFIKLNSDINDYPFPEDLLNRYKYVYNIQEPEMQFTFYDSNKYEIVKVKNISKTDLIIKGKTSNNSRPYTLIVFKKKIADEYIVLINVHFPQKSKNKNGNIIDITPNTYINNKIVEDMKLPVNSDVLDDIKKYIKISRIIVAGDFNRTVYSDPTTMDDNILNKDRQLRYYSNDKITGVLREDQNKTKKTYEIDNSRYGLKLFKGLFEDTSGNNDSQKSVILYNIAPDVDTFKTNTCNHGHVDNILDSFGLQYKYDYYNKNYEGSDHKAVLVTLLGAKPLYENELSTLHTTIFNDPIKYSTLSTALTESIVKLYDYPKFCYE